MISVITPCKNIVSEGRQPFFEKAMEGLRRQTHQDFEHILVDGASRDGTNVLLQKYKKDGLITRLISQKDDNLHQALNRALKEVRGDYIYVMNTDDYFATNDFFERSLCALEEEGVDYTHGDRLIIKREGGPPSVKRGDIKVAFFRMPFRWQTMLIRKSVYDEFAPFDEKYKIASDYKFMLQMVLSGRKGYYFPEILIYSSDGGITTDRQMCIEEVSEVIFECYGAQYGLSREECRHIYLKDITPEFFEKLSSRIDDQRIIKSLRYCYEYESRGQQIFE